MSFSVRYVLIGILAIIVIVLLLGVLKMYLLARKSAVLVQQAVPFERSLPDAKMKILVLGDSTAYGTGSESGELSTAGRLGALYPDASVTNLAVNGLRLEGLLKIVSNLDPQEHFSIILVQIGANDIIHLTSMKDIQSRADTMFAELSKKTDTLVVLHSGNIGESYFFPFYLKPILARRSFEMRDIYMKLAATYGAHYVDLINASSDDLLRDNPNTYYAADKLHLTGAGYGLWFDEIKKALPVR